MLHVGNTHNEAITMNNFSIWSLLGKAFHKIVFPARLLANVLNGMLLHVRVL